MGTQVILPSPVVTAPVNITNGGSITATLDASGQVIPSTIDPSTLYWVNDFIDYQSGYNGGGTSGYQATNALMAPLLAPTTIGIIYAGTSSSSAGGYYSTCPGSVPFMKSSTTNYQWRWIFRMPPASSGTNRYTVIVGGCNFTGAINTTNTTPVQGGPFLQYSDNLNSGKWVIGSAVNSVMTTANTSTVPNLNAWNLATCTLVNGTYTFVVNGVNIGTVTDANISTSPAVNQGATLGGIAILPDAVGFTTAAYVLLDRADLYVTGLTR